MKGLKKVIRDLQKYKSKKKCEHDWMFDSVFSYENGAEDLYVCTKCGKRK